MTICMTSQGFSLEVRPSKNRKGESGKWVGWKCTLGNVRILLLAARPFLVGGKLLVHAAVCVAHSDKLIVYRHTHTVQRHTSSVGGQ